MSFFQQNKKQSTMTLEQQLVSARLALLDKYHPVPAILDGPVEIRDLTQEQRSGLLFGPSVQIFVGDKYAGYIQMRAAMAVSPKLNAILQEKPLSTKIILVEDLADFVAVKTVLRFFSAKFLAGEKVLGISKGKNFAENARIYRAAMALGLGNHANYIKSLMYQTIESDEEFPTYEEFGVFLKSLETNDKLFQRTAFRYANLRYKNEIPDPEDFSRFLDDQPKLKEAMKQIDDSHAASRAQVQEEKAKKIEEQRQKREAKRKQDDKQKREAAKALKKQQKAANPEPAPTRLQVENTAERKARLRDIFDRNYKGESIHDKENVKPADEPAQS